MDDGQTLRSLVRDDAYVVERVLADGPSGRTEIVSLDGEGPLVRKRIPLAIANASAWAAAMEVDEPLLPRIESLYRMPDVLVVVYDYVSGDSLRDVVERDGRLTPERAVAVISDVCRAVGTLHERGVVHRDITPGNVILSDDGAHLVDLGIARQHVEGRRRDTTTLGTWGFAAPEQYGFTQTDARSDVYALGRLLGYLLTGESPDSEEYEHELADETRVPKGLAEVVRVATSFEPSARYQSAADLAAAASSALVGGRYALSDERWSQAPVDSPRAPKANEREATVRVPLDQMATDVSGPTDRAQTSEPRIPVGASARDASFGVDARGEAREWSEATSTQGVWTTGAYESAARKPAQTSRTFSQAPLYQRILAIFCWALTAIFAALVLLTAFSAASTGKPPWKPAQYGMCVVSILLCLAIVFEVYYTITRSGPHAGQTHTARQMAGNLVTMFVLYFVGLLACALFLPK